YFFIINFGTVNIQLIQGMVANNGRKKIDKFISFGGRQVIISVAESVLCHSAIIDYAVNNVFKLFALLLGVFCALCLHKFFNLGIALFQQLFDGGLIFLSPALLRLQ